MNKNTHSGLAKKKCMPCEGGVDPLKGQQVIDLSKQLNKAWKVVGDHNLERTFHFADFKEALSFVNKVGNLAEKEGHHPDVFLTWGKVKLTLSTHSINGLSENDFILAAKCDQL